MAECPLGATRSLSGYGCRFGPLPRHLRGPVVQAIESIAKLQQRRLRILEVGCGSGLASICLALQGHDVTAVDVSDHLLSEAGRLASAAGPLFPLRPLQIQFAPGNVFDLRQYAGQYDLVLSFGLRNLSIGLRHQARQFSAAPPVYRSPASAD